MAFWAFLLALLAMGATAVSAGAQSGGIGVGGPPATSAPAPDPLPFGSRTLMVGMEGKDVTVLNGIVKSKAYCSGVRIIDTFVSPTRRAVTEFQRRKGLTPSGVVDPTTSQALVGSMKHSGATYYGPGLYGNQTACGQTLTPATIGVANKNLPCGTKVTFSYHGHSAVAKVIDRGPYTAGYDWDLTYGLAQQLGFTSSGDVRYAIAH